MNGIDRDKVYKNVAEQTQLHAAMEEYIFNTLCPNDHEAMKRSALLSIASRLINDGNFTFGEIKETIRSEYRRLSGSNPPANAISGAFKIDVEKAVPGTITSLKLK